MMTRKMRRMLIIISIVLLLLVISGVLILLYINTDMFKSNTTLFTKYIGQNVENMDVLYNKIGESEYNNLLQQNKYTTETEVKVSDIENLGTTSEGAQNSINQLKLKITGQTDNSNKYNYQDVHLLSNDEEVSEIEYIQKENTYGIRFSDIFNQYILVENENLKELLKKADYTEEKIENIPDTLEFKQDYKEIFQFSEEEKIEIKTKYINIINSSISKNNFTKQKNQNIQIDGKNIKVNSYILTITKEQLNNIYLKILEEMKQDETILAKVDNVQTVLKTYQIKSTTNLREQFVKKLENLITDINRNNIGQDETKIIVYENNRTTVRTEIQTPDYEIYIDLLSNQPEDYMKIAYKDLTKEKEKEITYKKANEEANIVFKDSTEEEIKEYSISIEKKVDGNNCTKNIVAQYEDNSNRIEATIDQKNSIVDVFDNEVTLDDENSINLSKLETEQLQNILDTVNTGVSSKMNELTATVINVEDLWKVLRTIGFIKEGQVMESKGITETEKNRFNSQFEMLQGENLESDSILILIDAIKGNFIDIEVVSGTELRLKLDRFNKNEEMVTTLTSFIEENKNRKYNVKVEYDEETGLVSDLLITILEK